MTAFYKLGYVPKIVKDIEANNKKEEKRRNTRVKWSENDLRYLIAGIIKDTFHNL